MNSYYRARVFNEAARHRNGGVLDESAVLHMLTGRLRFRTRGTCGRRYWLGAVAVALAACGGANNLRTAGGDSESASPRVVEQLLAAERYSDAIRMVEQDPRLGGADHQAWLKRVYEKASAYDQAIGALIREAAEKADWRSTYRLVYESSQHYADGPMIRKAIEEFTPRQNARIAELRINLMIERADWLIKSRAVLEELAAVDLSNSTLAADLARTQEDARQLAVQLSNLGVDALSALRLDTAEKCLTKADELHPIAENILALERLDRLRHDQIQEQRNARIREEQERSHAETEKRKQQRRAEDERVQLEARKLVEEIRVATARTDLVRAVELMQRLRELDRANPNIPALDQALEVAVTARVGELLERGNDLYGNGNIKDAREVWEEARRLSPENARIRDRIRRADQVLSNLQEQQQRATAGAATSAP